jgi:hypothetical protein
VESFDVLRHEGSLAGRTGDSDPENGSRRTITDVSNAVKIQEETMIRIKAANIELEIETLNMGGSDLNPLIDLAKQAFTSLLKPEPEMPPFEPQTLPDFPKPKKARNRRR